MNYQNEIYKINDNLCIYKFFNFLKIEYDVILAENTNFVTNYKRNTQNENKYDFPYTLLNIDYANELLYKNEDNEWFLLKRDSYDTNLFQRCQQGEL